MHFDSVFIFKYFHRKSNLISKIFIVNRKCTVHGYNESLLIKNFFSEVFLLMWNDAVKNNNSIKKQVP